MQIFEVINDTLPNRGLVEKGRYGKFRYYRNERDKPSMVAP